MHLVLWTQLQRQLTTRPLLYLLDQMMSRRLVRAHLPFEILLPFGSPVVWDLAALGLTEWHHLSATQPVHGTLLHSHGPSALQDNHGRPFRTRHANSTPTQGLRIPFSILGYHGVRHGRVSLAPARGIEREGTLVCVQDVQCTDSVEAVVSLYHVHVDG